MIDLFNPHR